MLCIDDVVRNHERRSNSTGEAPTLDVSEPIGRAFDRVRNLPVDEFAVLRGARVVGTIRRSDLAAMVGAERLSRIME